MLNIADDGKHVELSYYVPAYHPNATPLERFRTESKLSYDKFLQELQSYQLVYYDCAVIDYGFVLEYSENDTSSDANYLISPLGFSFSDLVNAIMGIDDLFIHETTVLKAYFKLIKPLQYQQQLMKEKAKPKRKYRKRTNIPRGIRNEVFKRDNYTCCQCGAKKGDKKLDGTKVKLHIDHIKPVSKGGTDEMSNLQTLCDDCNLNKNDVYQRVRGMGAK